MLEMARWEATRECWERDGKGMHEHNRIRQWSNECRGASACEHKRRRSACQECGGTRICEQKRQRSKCKECGGVGISCARKRIRIQCKKCKADKDESMQPGSQ